MDNMFHSKKDSCCYLTFHMLASEVGFVIFLALTLPILLIEGKISVFEWTIVFVLALAYMFFKLFGMIVYYKFFYKKSLDSLVKKLMDWLRENKKHARLKFLSIMILYYVIIMMINVALSYYYVSEFFNFIMILYIFTSFVPYKMLFYYWDLLEYKDRTDATKFDCIKFLLRRGWLFVFVFIFSLIMASLFAPKYSM